MKIFRIGIGARFIAAGIACCAVLAIAGVQAYALRQRAIVKPPQNVSAQERFWEARIRAVGGMAAYQEFAHDVQGDDPGTQHGDAHIFGDALYTVAGLPGLSVCDSRFSYGCYHEFIGRAIADRGIDVINTLNSQCHALVNGEGCQHGIGHGILAYLGYKEPDLTRAVNTCSNLPGGSFIDGCYGGVFMEYNMRTLVDVNGPPRALDDGGLMSPCDSFAGEARQSCALLQPQWWGTMLPGTQSISGTALFSKMGTLCEGFGDAASVRACFEGIGWMSSALANYSPQGAARLCDATSPNGALQLYCLSYAASLFDTVGLGVDAGREVCAGLPPDSLAYCDEYAGEEANFNNPLELPQASGLNG
jgi:hypothetical protein